VIRIKIIFFTLIFLFIYACSFKDVDPEVMSKTYVDLLIAKESFPGGSDSLLSVSDSIFNKYNISSEDYYSTLKKYEADQKKWDEFFTKSREYLDSLKSKDKSI